MSACISTDNYGSFTWRKSPARRVKVGDEAGTFKNVRAKSGTVMRYKYIHVLTHQTPATRVAWLLTHRKWPDGNILFKDGNSENLCIDNLKEGDFPSVRGVKDGRRTYKMSSEAMRHYGLQRYYGLSLETFSLMLAAQNGVCAICKQPETAKSSWGGSKELSVDHNHENGEIRGLLCSRCNHVIGQCREDREILIAAVAYLDKYATVKREPPKLTVVPTEETK